MARNNQQHSRRRGEHSLQDLLSLTVGAFLLLFALSGAVAESSQVTEGNALPDETTPPSTEEAPRILIRGVNNGFVEVLVSGVLTELYPPGSLFVSGPGPAFLGKKEALRKEEKELARERVERFYQQRDEDAQAAQEAKNETAKKHAEAQEAREAAEERATLEKSAIMVQDSKTGELIKAVPVNRLPENNTSLGNNRRPKRGNTLKDNTAVNVWNPRESMWIKAVPLDQPDDKTDE